MPSLLRKVEDSCAPKMEELSAWRASSVVSGPISRCCTTYTLSTRNSAKKIGIWSRIGRHEENGLVPVFL